MYAASEMRFEETEFTTVVGQSKLWLVGIHRLLRSLSSPLRIQISMCIHKFVPLLRPSSLAIAHTWHAESIHWDKVSNHDFCAVRRLHPGQVHPIICEETKRTNMSSTFARDRLAHELPLDFEPSSVDVICGWARQNFSNGTCAGSLYVMRFSMTSLLPSNLLSVYTL